MADKNSIEQLKEDVLNQLKVDANTFIESSDALSQYSNDLLMIKFKKNNVDFLSLP